MGMIRIVIEMTKPPAVLPRVADVLPVAADKETPSDTRTTDDRPAGHRRR